ncbi:MAG: hypothetical protein GW875_10490 [Deltaproteobacteria bacterium]|nr:hypothetical protein [Deltaproteobacteria bacterium]NCP03037.1 hypothetical protein [Deltaproteobacteria bacterium]
MIVLPRGNSVKEGVNPARVNLPEAMDRLAASSFSGYLRFDSAKGCAVIVFRQGQLISACIHNAENAEKTIAYDALVRIFEMSLFEKTQLNIYRLTPEAALHIHAVLQADYVYQGRELAQLDVAELLTEIARDRLNCCVRVYAAGRTVLIFYADGRSLGFFHEGGHALEDTANLDTAVSRLPGAKLDLLSITFTDAKRMADLMASADLALLWRRVRNRLQAERLAAQNPRSDPDTEELRQRRQRVFTLLRGVAERHVGKFGVSQVDKSFKNISLQLNSEEMSQFYAEVARLTKLAAGPTKLRQMIDEMRQRVESFL